MGIIAKTYINKGKGEKAVKKSVVFLVLVLSMIMSLQVSAQNFFDDKPLYDDEEIVTFIVEMEDNPVLPEFNLSPETKGIVKSGSEQKYRSALGRHQA